MPDPLLPLIAARYAELEAALNDYGAAVASAKNGSEVVFLGPNAAPTVRIRPATAAWLQASSEKVASTNLALHELLKDSPAEEIQRHCADLGSAVNEYGKAVLNLLRGMVPNVSSSACSVPAFRGMPGTIGFSGPTVVIPPPLVQAMEFTFAKVAACRSAARDSIEKSRREEVARSLVLSLHELAAALPEGDALPLLVLSKADHAKAKEVTAALIKELMAAAEKTRELQELL